MVEYYGPVPIHVFQWKQRRVLATVGWSMDSPSTQLLSTSSTLAARRLASSIVYLRDALIVAGAFPDVVPLDRIDEDVRPGPSQTLAGTNSLSKEQVRDILGDGFSQSIVRLGVSEVTNIWPMSGPAAGGTVVSIRGTNLRPEY